MPLLNLHFINICESEKKISNLESMLSDFFRINLPYGMKRNTNNEWVFFNREYVPLGWNTTSGKRSVHENEEAFIHLPIRTKYKGLTEEKLKKLAIEPDAIGRDDDEKINLVFFYKDRTNPQSSPEHWGIYFEKIKLLSKCEVNKK